MRVTAVALVTILVVAASAIAQQSTSKKNMPPPSKASSPSSHSSRSVDACAGGNCGSGHARRGVFRHREVERRGLLRGRIFHREGGILFGRHRGSCGY